MPGATASKHKKASASTKDQAASSSALDSGRDESGRFTQGNAGGPGNPFARESARILQCFRSSFSDQDLQAMLRKLYEVAMTGDVSAMKLILAYQIGKPLPAPQPDKLDQEEWQHLKEDV